MKRPLLLILTIYIGHFCHAQQLLKPPAEYYSNLAIADSLSEIKEYTKATQHFNAAFEAFGWRGTRDDRFKAARIFALANNCDSSLKHIERIWKSQYINYLKITSDRAFDTLRRFDQIRFDTLIQHIKEVKEQVAPKQNLEWTNYFDSILVEDQVVRKKWKKVADIYGYNSKEAQQYWPEMAVKDSLNLIAVTHFLDTYGWQSKEVLGQNGNAALFLVIQHADSATQEKYLPIMKKAVKENKANPQDLALLIDRVCLRKHGYQIYGSQIQQDPATKKNTFSPIKNEKKVDKRRKKMNLQPLSEYGKFFGIDYKLKA